MCGQMNNISDTQSNLPVSINFDTSSHFCFKILKTNDKNYLKLELKITVGRTKSLNDKIGISIVVSSLYVNAT